MSKVKLMKGDNMESLKKLPDNSIDSIVSDPPYGLSFMGKKWDYDVPTVEFWKEVYRVLKPGGHVLSFGGTRTYHRMVVNIEDAGFEIRDQVMWLYGSGFPKSHNIGKAVDKIEGNEREVVGVDKQPRMNNDFGKGNHNEREVKELHITKGQSKYEGWGTALKPANEPICVARKPLSEKTIAENVIKWGTGGINIDGCRIGSENIKTNYYDANNVEGCLSQPGGISKEGENYETTIHEGRFPANIILDETAAELLDLQSGISKSSKINQPLLDITGGSYNKAKGNTDKITERGHNDSGGASRFFYVAKVSKKERNMGLDGFDDKITPVNTGINSTNENGDKVRNDGSVIPPLVAKNTHPTLKPINLMTYLCRLITPEGGIILDPFMGSGSTGIAACLEGFRFIGMEMDEDYFKIAEARINSYEMYRDLLKNNIK